MSMRESRASLENYHKRKIFKFYLEVSPKPKLEKEIRPCPFNQKIDVKSSF